MLAGQSPSCPSRVSEISALRSAGSMAAAARGSCSSRRSWPRRCAPRRRRRPGLLHEGARGLAGHGAGDRPASFAGYEIVSWEPVRGAVGEHEELAPLPLPLPLPGASHSACAFGSVNALAVDPGTGTLTGAADPRREAAVEVAGG